MKKTRIEITAFRRQVTVYSGDERSEDANGPSPSGAESWPSTDASDRPTIDLGESRNAILDTTRVDKACFPGKAPGESKGHSSIAAEKPVLKRRLHRKLRSLGLAIRNLKTSLKSPTVNAQQNGLRNAGVLETASKQKKGKRS